MVADECDAADDFIRDGNLAELPRSHLGVRLRAGVDLGVRARGVIGHSALGPVLKELCAGHLRGSKVRVHPPEAVRVSCMVIESNETSVLLLL